jgi:hypothetical protein
MTRGKDTAEDRVNKLVDLYQRGKSGTAAARDAGIPVRTAYHKLEGYKRGSAVRKVEDGTEEIDAKMVMSYSRRTRRVLGEKIDYGNGLLEEVAEGVTHLVEKADERTSPAAKGPEISSSHLIPVIVQPAAAEEAPAQQTKRQEQAIGPGMERRLSGVEDVVESSKTMNLFGFMTTNQRLDAMDRKLDFIAYQSLGAETACERAAEREPLLLPPPAPPIPAPSVNPSELQMHQVAEGCPLKHEPASGVPLGPNQGSSPKPPIKKRDDEILRKIREFKEKEAKMSEASRRGSRELFEKALAIRLGNSPGDRTLAQAVLKGYLEGNLSL